MADILKVNYGSYPAPKGWERPLEVFGFGMKSAGAAFHAGLAGLASVSVSGLAAGKDIAHALNPSKPRGNEDTWQDVADTLHLAKDLAVMSATGFVDTLRMSVGAKTHLPPFADWIADIG